MTTKPDTYTAVTDAIIAAIEAGTPPWSPEWVGGFCADPRRVTGDRYRGVNVLLLWLSAQQRGFAGRHWMTFRQAAELGGSIRKGEKATQIVFFKTLERSEERDGEEVTRAIPMLRSYHVFNTDQIDGLPDRFDQADIVLPPAQDRDNQAEIALRANGATIVEGGAHAFYRRNTDTVHLPDFERFRSTGGYLATLAHELVHWTGAPHRLDRVKGKAFGDDDYAFEELVAEIGAAFVCARLGVAGDHIESHAAYVSNWLQALKNDKRLIFRAASLAQAAADMVLAPAPVASTLSDLPALAAEHRSLLAKARTRAPAQLALI